MRDVVTDDKKEGKSRDPIRTNKKNLLNLKPLSHFNLEKIEASVNFTTLILWCIVFSFFSMTKEQKSTDSTALVVDKPFQPQGWVSTYTVYKELGYSKHYRIVREVEKQLENNPNLKKHVKKTRVAYNAGGQMTNAYYISPTLQTMLEVKSRKVEAKKKVVKTIEKQSTVNQSLRDIVQDLQVKVDKIGLVVGSVQEVQANMQKVEQLTAAVLGVLDVDINLIPIPQETKEKVLEVRSYQQFRHNCLETMKYKAKADMLIHKLYGGKSVPFVRIYSDANKAVNEARYRRDGGVLRFGEINTMRYSPNADKASIEKAYVMMEQARDYYNRLILIDDDRNGTLGK